MTKHKLTKQLELTHEQTSPLFRIMFTQNLEEAQRRHFENNICAFHIGQGYFLTVAHNLKTEAKIFKSIGRRDFSGGNSNHWRHKMMATKSFWVLTFPIFHPRALNYRHS
jgi:hypothetical protein